VARVWKNLQSRTFDALKEKLGVLDRCHPVLPSTKDERGEIDFPDLIHYVKSVAGKIIDI
jgi:ATP-dependent exoDNAse (exonuclease V) beta subunit